MAVSGYPFFRDIDHYNDYFKIWNFQNANDWARHDVEGHFYAGDVDKYDSEWRKIAKERNYDILYLQFEDIIK